MPIYCFHQVLNSKLIWVLMITEGNKQNRQEP